MQSVFNLSDSVSAYRTIIANIRHYYDDFLDRFLDLTPISSAIEKRVQLLKLDDSESIRMSGCGHGMPVRWPLVRTPSFGGLEL
jgi:hypothetical protein